MIKTAAIAAGLLALSHHATAQPSFPADAATATDNSGEAGNAPDAPNMAVASTGGPGLERQELIPVTSLPRTCDCIPAVSVVRSCNLPPILTDLLHWHTQTAFAHHQACIGACHCSICTEVKAT